MVGRTSDWGCFDEQQKTHYTKSQFTEKLIITVGLCKINEKFQKLQWNDTEFFFVDDYIDDAFAIITNQNTVCCLMHYKHIYAREYNS